MSHRSLATRLVVLLASFVIISIHIGMSDDSMYAMDDVAMESAHGHRDNRTVAPIDDQPTQMATPSNLVGSSASESMSMSMICQLLALASFIGFLVLRRSGFLRRVISSEPEHPPLRQRTLSGLRPARPPGLSVLCVANC